MSPERFALLPTTRHLLPIAVALGALMAIFAPGLGLRLGFSLVSLLLLGLQFYLRSRRPELVVTAEGYRVEVRGQTRLSVAWPEVVRVLCDPSEQALYVDCGDPGRNLLLPPERGYAFTFARRRQLYELLRLIVMEGLPDRLQEVTNLEEIASRLTSGANTG